MKNIYLLPDSLPHWKRVGEYLESANARVGTLDTSLSAQELREREPSLIVVGEAHASPQLLYRLRHYATVIISGKGLAGTVDRPPGNAKLATVTWPVEKDAFLNLSAEMARLSERRLFRAIVRIFPDDRANAFMGQSIDFSHSGMAFRAGKNLQVGEQVDVSLSLPSRGGTLRLPVEIMRIVGEEDQNTYGARFTELDRESRSLLTSFIAGQ